MTSTTSWADRRALQWVASYTRGLPEAVSDRRHDELESDLFEHRATVGYGRAQQLQVLGRVLWGIPADLSWRRAAKAPRERRFETGASMTLRKSTSVLLALFAVFDVLVGISTVTADGAGWAYAAPLLAAASLIAVGLFQREAAPRRSTILFIVAAAVPAVIFTWMVPIFVPLFLLVSAQAIASEPGRRRSQPTTV